MSINQQTVCLEIISTTQDQHTVRVCVYTCTLTWTVCHFFVSLLLTAASTKAEDALISLQRKVKAHRIQANDQIKTVA